MSVETSHYSVANNRDVLKAALQHCQRVAPVAVVAATSYGAHDERVFLALRIEWNVEPLYMLIRNSHGGDGALRFELVHLDDTGALVVYGEPAATHSIPHVGKMRDEKLPSFAQHSPFLRIYIEEAMPVIHQVRDTFWSPQRASALVDHLWTPPPPYDPTPGGDHQISPPDMFAMERTTRAHLLDRLTGVQTADEAFREVCRFVDFNSDATDKGDMTRDR